MRKAGHTKALWLVAGLVVILAGVVSYFAGSRPDALEYGVSKYAPGGQRPVTDQQGANVPLPEGAAPVAEHRPFASNAISGIAGAAVTFAVIAAVGFLITRRRNGGEAKPHG